MRANGHGRAFDRRFYGVVEAIVVDIVDPDREGRIKVRFPWYDEGTVTEWARVQQMYAGPGYGAFFVPEKDDEVLVAFIHGDMRMPIIIGGLYNGKDKPPSHRQEDDTKNEKMIRTRAGHMLLFDDTKDKEKIQLVTARGHSLSLDDAGQQITVSTSSGQTIVMDASDGSITLSGVTLTLRGDVSIELDAPAVAFTGSSVSLGAPSVGIGRAPTDRVVLGDRLMALFNSHVHPVGTGTTGAPVTPMSGAQLSAVATVE